MKRQVLTAGLVAGIALAISPAAVAQQIDDLVISAPWGGGGLRADAFSLFTNPANLAYTRGAHVAAGVQQPAEGRGGERIGLLGAYGSGRGFGAGLSSQWARDASTARTLSWGFGVGTERFAVGFASHDVLSPDQAGQLRRWDIGLMLRVTRHFGVHATARGLNRVRLHASGEPSVVGGGVTLQSADQAVGLDLGWLSALERRELASLNAQLLARVFGPIRVFASYQQFVLADTLAWRAQAGLQVSAAGASVSGHLLAASERESGWQFTSEFRTQESGRLMTGRPFYRLSLQGAWPESPGPSLLQSGRTHLDVLMALRQVAASSRMRGVVVDVEALTMGPAQLWEFCEALDAIRGSGKTVVLYLRTASPKVLALAAHADRVLVSPDVAALSTGIGVTATYLADLLALVGVEAQFVRIGDYKSSPERFLYDGPTDPARERLDAWLDQIWAWLNEDMSQLPGGAATVAALLESPPTLADELVETGVASQAVYAEDLYRAMIEEFGNTFEWTTALPDDVRLADQWRAGSRIAVLHVAGSITSGRSRYGLLSGEPTTGAATIAAQADAIARDSGIRGVIVRIDSPGGDADASDDIMRALIELAEDKPLVISMGDTAASGGYYAAATGDEIFLTPVTLTGSIGIYAGSFAVDRLLSRVGVNRVNFERGGRSDYFDLQRWDSSDISAIETLIENGYERFVGRVADARGLEPAGEEDWGQGRILSGVEAVELGLADSTGGFSDALAALVADAGLNPAATVTLEHYGVAGINSVEIGVGIAGAWQRLGFAVSQLIAPGQTSSPAYLTLLRELVPGPLLRFLDGAVVAETRQDVIRADLGWVLSWQD